MGMQRYKSQSAVPGASLTPMSGAAKSMMSASKPKDLTDTLMSQNLGQMRVSQSMNQFPQPPQSSSSTMGMGMTPSPSPSGTSQWGSFSQAPAVPMMPRPSMPQNPQMQQQPRPNMSAFDSLLSMPSQQIKTSMNAMTTPLM